MKILGISLLRLGDAILTLPALSEIKRLHPKCELHVLLNSSTRGLSSFLNFVDQIHFFPRELLQNGIGESGYPAFYAYDVLSSFVDEMNQQKFDRVINLTHTKLSGYLCGLIEGAERDGLVAKSHLDFEIRGEWFNALNEFPVLKNNSPLHFSEILTRAVGSHNPGHPICLSETLAGQIEFQQVIRDEAPYICAQVLTSDPKKNWSLSKWESALTILGGMLPSYRMILLCSESEREAVSPLVDRLNQKSVHAVVACVGLDGALSILRQAKLLITGDTAIKHIAAATTTPILELSLGSSHFRQTGPFNSGAIILQSRVPCAPCEHRNPCSQKQHLCGEKLSVDVVVATAHALLKGSRLDLRAIGHEFEDEVEMYQSHLSHAEGWTCTPIGQRITAQSIRDLVEASALKFLMGNLDSLTVGPFGTEGRRLKRVMVESFPDVEVSHWNQLLNELDHQYLDAKSTLEVLDRQIDFAVIKNPTGDRTQYLQGIFRDFKLRFLSFEGTEDLAVSVGDLAQANPETEFMFIREAKERVQKLRRKSNIKIKFVRSLISEFMEEHR